MLIAIDHGNHACKTVHYNFVSGLAQHSVRPPMADEVLEYNGEYWTLSGQRLPYRRDKTRDESFFILTLFAIAKELAHAGPIPSAEKIDLAVGLPPEHYGLLKDKFRDYFKRNQSVQFIYNDKPVTVMIRDVFVYPQAFAAIAPQKCQLKHHLRLFLVDIGGYTTDVLLLRQGKREYEQRRDAGMLAAMDYSFAEWADFWFEHHKNLISVTTQESYSYTLRNLKNHFGRRKLSSIKAYDIEQYLMKLVRDGRSSSTVAQSRGMLFQIFKMAVANDILMKNPVAHAEKIRRAPPKPKEAYTADEVRKLMKELPDDRIGWSIRLLLGTGMRTQELLALEPRHIAKDGSSINVAQAVVMEGGKPKIGPTKTHTSMRTIPVPEMVRYCARNLRNTDRKFIWEGGRTGIPCNPSYFRSQFKEAIEAIEDVRVLTPHCCRHTYVSQMLALGVDPKTIQAMVGHAEIDMTMYYAHAQESSKQAAISRYDEAFSADGGGLYGNILTFVKSG